MVYAILTGTATVVLQDQLRSGQDQRQGKGITSLTVEKLVP
jgi:hypothetical protein